VDWGGLSKAEQMALHGWERQKIIGLEGRFLLF